MPPILEVSGLSYSYHTISGETKALSDISFQVETGEFIAIVGPSGCGKSTLLSRVSNARPKIANYHFTTLNPHLGLSLIHI